MNPLAKCKQGIRIILIGAAVLAGCASAPIRSDPRSLPDQPDKSPSEASPDLDLASLRAKVVEAHNRIRAEQKLLSLAVSEKLQAAAQSHARDMAARRKMTHQGSRLSRLPDRIKAQGYPYRRVGENVAMGQFTVDRLMKGWMDSPPHKRNILGGFSQIGVGCAIAEDGKPYWCVNFGLPVRR
jgi:uncharacterized protein YkwD